MTFAKSISFLAAAATLAGLGAPAVRAQNDVLNIPENIEFIGTNDPNLRRATARVNGNIITGTDVDHRVALILDSNDVTIPEDEMRALRLDVLRSLIDETLQVQEAAALEMQVSEDDVSQAYAGFARDQFEFSPEQLDAHLASIGSSARSLKRQIQGQIAWRRLLTNMVAPFVNVSSAEVTELVDRMQASRGTAEYRIGEIYLSANDTNREQVLANAQQIVERLGQGGSFVAYARQFSEASTAAVGGDLGWIRLEQLQNPTLEQTAREMTAGQLAGPIEVPGGYSLLLLIDQRQIGLADPRDALVQLKQIAIDFAPGTPEPEAEQIARRFAEGVAQMEGCSDANMRATALGAEVVDNDGMAIRALPEALQDAMLTMAVGESTPPFGSLEEGVRVLMLCGRQEPASVAGPNFEELMTQIEDERINRRAQSYLRDLRRDAVIDYN